MIFGDWTLHCIFPPLLASYIANNFNIISQLDNCVLLNFAIAIFKYISINLSHFSFTLWPFDCLTTVTRRMPRFEDPVVGYAFFSQNCCFHFSKSTTTVRNPDGSVEIRETSRYLLKLFFLPLSWKLIRNINM